MEEERLIEGRYKLKEGEKDKERKVGSKDE